MIFEARTFFELIRVCERLDLFDAVVAENGGVLDFPAAGVLRDPAPPPPARLVAELGRHLAKLEQRPAAATRRAERRPEEIRHGE